MHFTTRREILKVTGLIGAGMLGKALVARGQEDERIIDVPIRAVDVPPILNQTLLPQQAYSEREGATYQSGTVTNGHGRCYGVEATVQIGTSVELDVDLRVKALSIDHFREWQSRAQQYFSSSSWSYLQEHYSGSGRAGGFFGGCFGSIYARGQYDHYKNRSDSYQSSGSQTEEGFAKSVYSLDNSDLHVTGKVTAIGQSYVPVSVSVYINLTRIEFADGKVITAIDTRNPAVADANGRTGGAAAQPTDLNAVAL